MKYVQVKAVLSFFNFKINRLRSALDRSKQDVCLTKKAQDAKNISSGGSSSVIKKDKEHLGSDHLQAANTIKLSFFDIT